MAERPVILVQDLRYAYRKAPRGQPPALDGLSFEVQRGEIFGLLGPNGAGKTTAVRILTTLLRPDGGQALVDGFDVMRQPLEDGVTRRQSPARHTSPHVSRLSSTDAGREGCGPPMNAAPHYRDR
jgi:ABC-type multidrug transport system ATPase subunit